MLKEPNCLVWDDRLLPADKEHVGDLNAALIRLNGIRAVEINVSGPFARSKIAWKLATYQHALLHRLVALTDGVAIAWNNRSTLSAILSARAFMETFSVMAEFETRTAESLANEDLAQLDALAHRGIFASRDSEWLRTHPETEATNILTYVDKFDKRVPGFRAHFNALSERCHPNYLGHTFMFSELDRSNGTVRYSDERNSDQRGQMILAALSVLPLMESMMTRLDDSIRKVSDLHHRVAPAGGSHPASTPTPAAPRS